MKQYFLIFSRMIIIYLIISILLSCSTSFQPEEEQGNNTVNPTMAIPPIPTQTVLLPTRITNFTPELEAILPPKLAWDFYPNGITRTDLLARLPEAIQKSGYIREDEVWFGVIHITGDIEVAPKITLTIEPGTLILISAKSDDQNKGFITESDPMNPKDLPVDTSHLVSFRVEGNIFVNGTVDNPVIFTSDSENPQNKDWDELMLAEGSKAEINGAIIEYCRYLGIFSSDFILKRSIIRNFQGCINPRIIKQGDTLEELIDFSFVITENYIYNMGRYALGILGSPEISHNVIIGRYDLEFTGWEHGAVGNDFYTCPNIHHNYLEAGMPRPYDDYIYNEYQPFTNSLSANLNGLCLNFEYNTVIGSPHAINSRPGHWSIEHNNIIPLPVTGELESLFDWEKDGVDCLTLNEFIPEPNDPLQFEMIKKYGWGDEIESFSAINNYWGTKDPALIGGCIHSNTGVQISYEPFEPEFIEEALPDWQNFLWN